MDWATDSAWMIPKRWALFVLGWAVCATGPGCGRMSPFVRDEPPLLGSSTAPKTQPVARRSTADLLSQRFGRTRPKPAADDTSDDDAPGTKPVSSELDPPKESHVRTTGLSTDSEVGDAIAVTLNPPVSTNVVARSRSTAHPTAHFSRSEVAPKPILVKPIEMPAPIGPIIVAPLFKADSLEPPTPSPSPTALSVIADAQKRLDAMTSYQVEINRQERVGTVLQEPEDVVLSIRRNPKAVRLEWRKGPHQGREVLFAAQETNGLMRINMADSPIPIPPLALPPDSPLVLRNSRHPITEAGLDTVLANLRRTVDANEANDFETHGRITYAGLEQADQLDHPCHKIVHAAATGENWQVFLDPGSKLPVMVQSNASGGELLERYFFREVHADPVELASADAFDPNRRWANARGLLSRLAAPQDNKSSSPSVTR
jgi:hypothetical protein